MGRSNCVRLISACPARINILQYTHRTHNSERGISGKHDLLIILFTLFWKCKVEVVVKEHSRALDFELGELFLLD